MISGPVMIQALEGENAIAKNRDLMGATDPKKAARAPSAPTSPTASTPTPCTVRMRLENAAIEIAYFFPDRRLRAPGRKARSAPTR
jgi:nucleoside-diphosphate kinase